MLKVDTDAKINGLHIETFSYNPPLLKANIGLLASGQLCAHGEAFAWSEETEKLLRELVESMEKDCARMYFGKADIEDVPLYDVPSDKRKLSIPEDRFHDEYEVEQY